MFYIAFGFVLPQTLAYICPHYLLFWALWINVTTDEPGVIFRLKIRLFGLELMFAVMGTGFMQENIKKPPKISVSETILDENGVKTTKKSDISDKKINENSPEGWGLMMMAMGYKFLIYNMEVFNEADRSFVLPKDDEISINMGDRVAFGSRESWVGMSVTGLKDRGPDIIYYVDAIRKSTELG